MNDVRSRVGRGAIQIGGTLLTLAVAILLFVVVPGTMTELVGVVLVLVASVVGFRTFATLATHVHPPYDVAEVSIEGPITRGGGRPLPTRPSAVPVGDVVDQIDAANEDPHVQGLLLELNTPGGEVVPSDDIRSAIERFDGPTVAYVTDVCASGGYWIASACDELFGRDTSLVGGIGILGSRVTAVELAERIGLSYERFTAGRYKDTGVPLRELDDDERSYLQGLIDEFYETFVERVALGRGLDVDRIRETEARIYVGERALDLGLVDAVGVRSDAKDRLGELSGIDAPVVERFEPERGIADRLRGGVEAVAYAAGCGVASAIAGEDRYAELRL